MDHLNFTSQKFWSVSEVNGYLRDLLEGDPHLQEIWVQGEVSNISQPRSGHIYFTLKDFNCALRCVMWKNNVNQQLYIPIDGHAVEVYGNISVYEAQGQYQLYATIIRSAGEGILYQEFLQLKTKLEKEGLFSIENKRKIPDFPKLIGIVTSPTGAALRDILNTLQRRFPLVEVVLAPTQVQGIKAPEQIVEAIQSLNQTVKPDVIILARGGGSIEDLLAFNDERVARAIVNSNAPVITGVGHETDFTIADFAADLRAPTPTAAAEIASPRREVIISYLKGKSDHHTNIISKVLEIKQQQLSILEYRTKSHSPIRKIPTNRQKLDELSHRNSFALTQSLRFKRTKLNNYSDRYISLNPSAIINRGYTIITNLDGEIIKSIHQVDIGETLHSRLADGTIDVQVDDIRPNGH